MTKEELIEKLTKIYENGEYPAPDHENADELLLQYIDDDDVRNAFERIEKWYA